MSDELNEQLALAEQHDAAGRHDDAINVLALATQKGDIEAMTRLAKRLILGENAPCLPNEGVGFLVDAANKGGAEATARLAVLSAAGAYVDQSWDEAVEILVVAAERGWLPARGQLSVLATDRQLAGSTNSQLKEGDGYWRKLGDSIDLDYWMKSDNGNTLNADPLIRSFPDFVSADVCNWLIGLSQGRLKRARVYDSVEKRETVSNTRTNTFAAFNLMQTDVVHLLVQARMAAACRLHIENMEAATVLHYDIGEQIENHYDFIDPKSPDYDQEIARNGQRVITFLVYLNENYAGGETDFPKLDISHKGAVGEGLYFVNALPSGESDLRTVHAGRAITEGEKWILSQFIRNRKVLQTSTSNESPYR